MIFITARNCFIFYRTAIICAYRAVTHKHSSMQLQMSLWLHNLSRKICFVTNLIPNKDIFIHGRDDVRCQDDVTLLRSAAAALCIHDIVAESNRGGRRMGGGGGSVVLS